MIDNSRILFIHGSESNGQTYKASLLRKLFPDMHAPNFTDNLDERLTQLRSVIGETTGWTLVGSSLGGLTAAIFAAQSPAQVRKLVLLAPALALPEFEPYRAGQIAVPTVVIHGAQDEVVPLDSVRLICERVFPQLTYRVVDDDHRLHKTAERLDWRSILD
jgi:pimeloyl-ACP methyl ester carboxylesterase